MTAAVAEVEAGFVLIDGSEGEGGGQVIRNSVAYSCLLGKPVWATKIVCLCVFSVCQSYARVPCAASTFIC